tara:strand:- start:101 stop:262 length:162 start_codon:yes stop_codon:yes gene_type:complete
MRCKACDAVLKPPEIIWRPEIKQHEELCKKCRLGEGLDVVSEQELRDEGWKLK